MSAKQFFVASQFDEIPGHEKSKLYIPANEYIVHEVHKDELYIIEIYDGLAQAVVGVAYDHMHAIDIIETHRNR